MKQYSISTIDDIKQFFKDVHVLYPLEWHPDDDFHFFMKQDEVSKAFTEGEAEYLNRIMTECFQYCDDNDLDVYEIASQVQIELWKNEGKWPSFK